MPSILDWGKKKSYSPEVDAKVARLNIEIKEAREKAEELEKVVSQYTKKLDNAFKRENLFARTEKEYGHGKHSFIVPPFFKYSRDLAEDMAFNAHFNKLEKENIFKRIGIGLRDALFVGYGFLLDLVELPGFIVALGGVNAFKGVWNAATKGAEQKAEDKYRAIHDKLFAEELMYKSRWNKLIDERNAIVAEYEGRTKDYEAFMQYRANEEAAEIEYAKKAGLWKEEKALPDQPKENDEFFPERERVLDETQENIDDKVKENVTEKTPNREFDLVGSPKSPKQENNHDVKKNRSKEDEDDLEF